MNAECQAQVKSATKYLMYYKTNICQIQLFMFLINFDEWNTIANIIIIYQCISKKKILKI